MSGRRWREERFSWMMFLPAESSGTCTFLTALFCVSFCTGNLQRETTVETRFLLFFFLHFFSFFFFLPPLVRKKIGRRSLDERATNVARFNFLIFDLKLIIVPNDEMNGILIVDNCLG